MLLPVCHQSSCSFIVWSFQCFCSIFQVMVYELNSSSLFDTPPPHLFVKITIIFFSEKLARIYYDTKYNRCAERNLKQMIWMNTALYIGKTRHLCNVHTCSMKHKNCLVIKQNIFFSAQNRKNLFWKCISLATKQRNLISYF